VIHTERQGWTHPGNNDNASIKLFQRRSRRIAVLVEIQSAKSPSQISVLQHTLGAPTTITPEITEPIHALTDANREMSSDAVAAIHGDTPGMQKISVTSVNTTHHRLGDKVPSPITAFPLTREQIPNRAAFPIAHRTTGWSRTVFPDEGSFVLGARRWVWGWRG
jgi:hypothetical protein